MRVSTILLFLIITTTLFGEVYRIRKGDRLLIAVIGQPEYSHSVQVREDGRISYIGGDLQVAGKTTEEVNGIIRDFLLKEKLINNPIILVSPLTAEKGVFVGGAVNIPGRYVISPESDIDLYRAIALAGGIKENADPQKVLLIRYNAIRQTNDSSKQPQSGALTRNEQKVVVENYDLSKNKPYRYIRVNSNDLVFVNPLSVIEVQGEVKTPGETIFQRKDQYCRRISKSRRIH